MSLFEVKMKKIIVSLLTGLIGLFGSVIPSFAAWTPLVDSTIFDGPKADLNTIVLGMIGLFIIVFAGGLIIRNLRN